MSEENLSDYKFVMRQMVEALLEYGKTHKGQVEGLMAYDVLLTAQEEAETIGISLKDVGLTDEIVKSLL